MISLSRLVDVLKCLKHRLTAWLLVLRLRREARQAFAYDRRQFMSNAGALHLDRKAAACAEIVMGYHVLEKGLTMPHRRMEFGRGAIVHLINLIESFEKRFGGDSQVTHAAGVLRAYRDLHVGQSLKVMPRLESFLAAHPDVPAAHEPHVSREVFYAAREASFPEFASSRHVVRHFAGPVPREKIEAAVRLATTAPSACNRQHVRVHAVDDPVVRTRLLELQGGSRGFGADADKVLVVTADLSSVRWAWERHDIYTNGGIFVMNLSYSLFYQGIAHCILHWSVPPSTDRSARKLLGLPDNEAIVQLFACGQPPEEFDVAASPRRPLEDILSWYEGARPDGNMA